MGAKKCGSCGSPLGAQGAEVEVEEAALDRRWLAFLLFLMAAFVALTAWLRLA